MKSSLLSLCLALAALATARAATSAEFLTTLRAALAAEIQATRKTIKGNEPSEKLQVLTNALQQLEAVSPDQDGAGQYYQQSLAMLQAKAGSEKIAQLARTLAVQLGKEQQARFQATANEFNTLGKRCAEQGFAATKSQQLDAPIEELGKALNSSQRSLLNTMSNESGVLGTNLAMLATLLQNRQDYLLKMEAGDKDGALRVLQQRRSDREAPGIPWIPRSALVKSLEEDRKAAGAGLEELGKR